MHSSKFYSLAALAAAFWLQGVLAANELGDMPKDCIAWRDKGAQRWKDIQAALTDKSGNDEPPSDFCDSLTTRFSIKGIKNPPRAATGRWESFIHAAGLPFSATGANNFAINIGYPDTGDGNIPTVGDDRHLVYENYYNPKDNVIVASDIWKGRTGKGLQPFSRVTWTMWDEVKTREGGKPGDLRSLVHYTCQNDGAITVADWLCDDGDTYADRTLTLLPDEDAFNAVLGIDNGATAKGIVTQHKRAMNFKTIKTITVVCDGQPLMGVSYNFG